MEKIDFFTPEFPSYQLLLASRVASPLSSPSFVSPLLAVFLACIGVSTYQLSRTMSSAQKCTRFRPLRALIQPYLPVELIAPLVFVLFT